MRVVCRVYSPASTPVTSLGEALAAIHGAPGGQRGKEGGARGSDHGRPRRGRSSQRRLKSPR